MPSPDFLIQNTPLYPLRFFPIYKDYLWGGGRFRSLFHRNLSEEKDILAESWEISDHPNGRSIIRSGPLAGTVLTDIVRQRADSLFGPGCFPPNLRPERFPLILKYLDARQSLSVQVHPNDRLAEEMQLEDPGKTEVWIVMDAEPDSTIWVGTDRTYPKEELQEIIRQGKVRSVLHEVPVRIGDCFYLRPGTLHALGQGVMVVEVQTSSDTTFRVFDWDRVAQDGRPRELRTEDAIRALERSSGPVLSKPMLETNQSSYERLVVDEHFTVNRWGLNNPFLWCSDNRCHLWTVLEGSVQARYDDGLPVTGDTLHLGESILVPATVRQIHWTPATSQRAVLLDVIVPGVAENQRTGANCS